MLSCLHMRMLACDINNKRDISHEEMVNDMLHPVDHWVQMRLAENNQADRYSAWSKGTLRTKEQLTFRIHRPRSSRVAQRLRGRPLLRRALLQRHAIGKAADGRKTLVMLLMRRRPRSRPAITHDLCSRRKHGRKVRCDRLVAASRRKVDGVGNSKIEQIRKRKVGCSKLDGWRKFAA